MERARAPPTPDRADDVGRVRGELGGQRGDRVVIGHDLELHAAAGVLVGKAGGNLVLGRLLRGILAGAEAAIPAQGGGFKGRDAEGLGRAGLGCGRASGGRRRGGRPGHLGSRPGADGVVDCPQAFTRMAPTASSTSSLAVRGVRIDRSSSGAFMTLRADRLSRTQTGHERRLTAARAIFLSAPRCARRSSGFGRRGRTSGRIQWGRHPHRKPRLR